MSNTTNCDRLVTSRSIALFCVAVALLLLAMRMRLGLEMADDAAFFLRYAENMLHGEFWVWNLGEAPVWGASAPLYPLVVAAAMKLGFAPEVSIIAVSMGMGALALAAVGYMLGHRVGCTAGISFIVFSALDTGMMYFSGAGLESPLTVALLAFALATLFYQPQAWLVGLVAGLLMVNKLDLIPIGGLLLCAHWLRDKRMPTVAIAVAAAIAFVWYLFAWWHFGAPVPNSFLTKSLHQDNLPKIIDWTWFGGFVLWEGIHKWLLGLSLFGLVHNWRSLLPQFVFLLGTLFTHLVAYTIKYPFEPYNWYGIPSLFVLLVCGSLGIYSLGEAAKRIYSARWVPALVSVVLISVVVIGSIRMEIFGTTHIKMFASHHEYDRAEAGRWVAANTPKDFVVYTMWGNPAFYSQRKVLDGSFLNRRYEQADLIKTYRPEILILQNNPGSTPMNPIFAATTGDGYRVVKVFDKTYSAGMDYFFVVLAREDVLKQIREIDTPRDLMKFINSVVIGNDFGVLKPQGVNTLFVHPGASTATSFSFDASAYLTDSDNNVMKVSAKISPNIPREAVKRGGGNVRVLIMQEDRTHVDAIVKIGEPMQRTIPVENRKPLLFKVENNGSADSDWLLLTIE